MIPMHLTFVYEPPRITQPTNSSGPERYTRFIEDLGRHAGISVAYREGVFRDVAPDQGFILLHTTGDPAMVLSECAPERRAEYASRLVPVGVDRTKIFDRVLENLSLPAAVDALTFFEWETRDPAHTGARGPHGLSELAPQIGARCLLFKSARYCYLASDTHEGLPHLLADYLLALHRTTGAGGRRP
jgi:hypothetical protein